MRGFRVLPGLCSDGFRASIFEVSGVSGGCICLRVLDRCRREKVEAPLCENTKATLPLNPCKTFYKPVSEKPLMKTFLVSNGHLKGRLHCRLPKPCP